MIYLYRALWRLRISREPFGLAGARPHLAPALAGRLPANFNACAAQQGLRLVRAAAAPRVLTDKLQHVKNRSFQKKFVRYAATNSQNTALDAALLRLSR